MSSRWFDSSRQIFWDNNQQDLTVPGSLTGTSSIFNSLTVPGLLEVSNIGQNIGDILTPVPSVPAVGSWASIAISATGQYQSAINQTYNAIYISNDYGNTWTSIADSQLALLTTAMSASGQFISAIGYDNISFSGYYIYISSNYGVSWTYSSFSNINEYTISISATGQYQTVVVSNDFIYISSDNGNVWTPVDSQRNWYTIAMSNSGQYQTATALNVTGTVYKSSNYGMTWVSVSVNAGQTNRYVAISATGQYQIVIADGTNNIYLSNNSGMTWNPTATALAWNRIAISSSGQYMIAYETTNNYIWISSDYGVTWTTNSVTINLTSMALSGSADHFTIGSDTLYTSIAITGYAMNVIGNANVTSTLTTQNLSSVQLQTSSIVSNNLLSLTAQIEGLVVSSFTGISFSTTQFITSSIGVNCNSPQYALDVNGVINTSSIICNNISSLTGQIRIGILTVAPTQLAATQIGVTWSSVASTKVWRGIGMSATGQYQSASVYNAVIGPSSGTLWISSDYGETWSTVGTSQAWEGIAVSGVGQYQSVCAFNTVWTSSNFGSTWTAVTPAPSSGLQYITISYTGQYQAVCGNGTNLYTSSDSGSTWIVRTTGFFPGPQGFTGISMSASGQYQAVTINGDGVYISNNFGATWTIIAFNQYTGLGWTTVTMSATGQYLSAVYNSKIYISNNYGISTSWTASTSPSLVWTKIAMSESGQYQAAVANPGNIYISYDYGSNWTSVESSRAWKGVAMSATGQYVSAAVNNGTLYRSTAPIYNPSIGINCNVSPYALDVNGIINTSSIICNNISSLTGQISINSLITHNLSSVQLQTSSIVSNNISSLTQRVEALTVSSGVINVGQVSSLATISGSFSNLTIANNFYSWQTTTTGDSFTTGEISNFRIGTSNFTIECFFNPTSTPASDGAIFSIGNQNLTGQEFRVGQRIGSSGLGFICPNESLGVDISVSLAATSTLSIGTWCHLALVRSTPTNLLLYSNGVAVLSTNAVNYTNPTNKILRLFRDPYGFYNYGQGYMNSMRVVIGQTLYHGNFIPPTQQLSTNTVGAYGFNVSPSITGTVAFLGGIVSTLTDAGPSALALTVAGSPRSGTAVPTTFTGRIGINCNSPQFALDVNGGANIYGNLFLGRGVNAPILPSGYNTIGLSGGNSWGYMYGAYGSLDDGIHLSYNYISSNLGPIGDTRGYIPNIGGGTSQLDLQYNQIQFKTGANNTAPSTRMTLTTGGLGINCNVPTVALDVNGTIRAASINTIAATNVSNVLYAGGFTTSANTATLSFQTQGGGGGTVEQRIVSRYEGTNYGISIDDVSNSKSNNLRITNGNVGIGVANPSAQLELSTDSAKKPTTSTWTISSDQRIKKHISSANLELCYSTLKQIDLKYFEWDRSIPQLSTVQDCHSLGFIAQEIKPIFPNAVTIDSNMGLSDFHSLNVDQIFKMHYGATKKLMELVEQQGSTIQGIQKELSTLRG